MWIVNHIRLKRGRAHCTAPPTAGIPSATFIDLLGAPDNPPSSRDDRLRPGFTLLAVPHSLLCSGRKGIVVYRPP